MGRDRSKRDILRAFLRAFIKLSREAPQPLPASAPHPASSPMPKPSRIYIGKAGALIVDPLASPLIPKEFRMYSMNDLAQQSRAAFASILADRAEQEKQDRKNPGACDGSNAKAAGVPPQQKNELENRQHNDVREDPPAPILPPEQVISLDRAVEIFDRLADHEDIAFGYARDGCHARAYLMCAEVIEMGLCPKKAWAFEGESHLAVLLPGQSAEINWWFHVALALPVRMPDGSVTDLVFDPGLFDGPVTLQEWGKIMKAPPEKLQIKPYGTPPDGYKGDYCPYEKTWKALTRSRGPHWMMEEYKQAQIVPRRVFPSPLLQEISALQQPGNQQASRQGKSWQSWCQEAEPHSDRARPAPDWRERQVLRLLK